jgi:hypothetical protein
MEEFGDECGTPRALHEELVATNCSITAGSPVFGNR